MVRVINVLEIMIAMADLPEQQETSHQFIRHSKRPPFA
jgi:hypothetical protein